MGMCLHVSGSHNRANIRLFSIPELVDAINLQAAGYCNSILVTILERLIIHLAPQKHLEHYGRNSSTEIHINSTVL